MSLRSPRNVLKQLLRRKVGLVALTVLVIFYTLALIAPFVAPYSASDQNLEKVYHPPSKVFWEGGLRAQVYENIDPLASTWVPIEGDSVPLHVFGKGAPYKLFGLIPTDRHLLITDSEDPEFFLLGSDPTGRDVFSRLLYGAQISLSIGLIGISITLLLGFFVGALAGYFGGKVDFIAMRLVEVLMTIPGLYLLLALRAAFMQQGLSSTQIYLAIIICLSFIGWAGTSRVIRGMTLSLRRQPYVLAAESMGQHPVKILFKHILPNLTSYLLVVATLGIPAYILGEAALSFLGLGIQDPDASWGLMLSQAQDMKVFMLGFWWLLTPGLMIFITVIAFNVLGDNLRDIVDPKMKGLR
ncbi:MAG: ABC transporter permease [Verrucomicrobiota bacterium]